MSALEPVQHYPVASLPPDMQLLLADLAEDAGAYLPRFLPLVIVAVSVFPDVVTGSNPSDSRDREYVHAMVGRRMPPVLITKGFLIDGRHRICALRIGQVATAECLDLSDVIPVPAVPCIGALKGEAA